MNDHESAIQATQHIALELGRYILHKDQSSFIWMVECLQAIELYTGKGDQSVTEIFERAKNDKKEI